MRRETIVPRDDFTEKLEAQGLSFHARDSYWKEDACYRFDLKQVETVEAATNELHQMCIAALKNAIDTERLGRLAIPQPFWDPIAASLKGCSFTYMHGLPPTKNSHSSRMTISRWQLRLPAPLSGSLFRCWLRSFTRTHSLR